MCSLYAEIEKVGKTSITVNVEVYAQRNPEDVEVAKVTEATLTYVAIGKDKRPSGARRLSASRKARCLQPLKTPVL
jgi:acyl-CoA hydrolase